MLRAFRLALKAMSLMRFNGNLVLRDGDSEGFTEVQDIASNDKSSLFVNAEI